MAAIAVSLGSMIVGFSSGYTSPALPSMKDGVNSTSFEMTENQETWIGSIMPLAGLFGGIAGGPLIEYLGRKNTILGTGLPFAISWLLIGCAANVYMVLAGRALSGFCIGIASLALPVYLGETVQPEVRGTLGLLPTAFGNTGKSVDAVHTSGANNGIQYYAFRQAFSLRTVRASYSTGRTWRSWAARWPCRSSYRCC